LTSFSIVWSCYWNEWMILFPDLERGEVGIFSIFYWHSGVVSFLTQIPLLYEFLQVGHSGLRIQNIQNHWLFAVFEHGNQGLNFYYLELVAIPWFAWQMWLKSRWSLVTFLVR
jgi:hypothetical protein